MLNISAASNAIRLRVGSLYSLSFGLSQRNIKSRA
jgi:hypothetical protein